MFKITFTTINANAILWIIFALILGCTGVVGWWTILLIAASTSIK